MMRWVYVIAFLVIAFASTVPNRVLAQAGGFTIGGAGSDVERDFMKSGLRRSLFSFAAEFGGGATICVTIHPYEGDMDVTLIRVAGANPLFDAFEVRDHIFCADMVEEVLLACGKGGVPGDCEYDVRIDLIRYVPSPWELATPQESSPRPLK